MNLSKTLSTFPKTEWGSVSIWNAKSKFQDWFSQWFDTSIWDESWTNKWTWFTRLQGDGSWASYLNISMCPYTPWMEYILTSKQMFRMPIRFGYGLSISQRVLWDEVQVALVWCDENGVVEKNTPIPPLAISFTHTQQEALQRKRNDFE